MPNLIRSSSASAPCRLERRASPLLIGALLLLADAAAFAVLVSEMPRVTAWPLAVVALAHGARLAWREAGMVPGEFVVPHAGARPMVDGKAVDGLVVRWRGPIAFLQWRDGDGHRRRHVFFPDTLPAARRRELRLAAPAPVPARRVASVAP
jgi:toxin CptA